MHKKNNLLTQSQKRTTHGTIECAVCAIIRDCVEYLTRKEDTVLSELSEAALFALLLTIYVQNGHRSHVSILHARKREAGLC